MFQKGTVKSFSSTPPLWTDLVKISSRKLRHTSFFSAWSPDFKNVIFENIHWAHSEDAEVAEVKPPWNPNDENSKWKLVKTRWNPKFGHGDLENDLLTSTTSEWAQWFFSKITFLNSGDQAEKNEL